MADKGYGWETCFVDLVGFFFLKFLVFGRTAMHGSPWAETLLRYFGFLFLAGGLLAGQGGSFKFGQAILSFFQRGIYSLLCSNQLCKF